MEEIAIKTDLHNKIEHADLSQLKDLYGLVTNYFNSNQSTEEWDLLPESQKRRIKKGIEQADGNLGTPVKEAIQNVRAKYGLND